MLSVRTPILLLAFTILLVAPVEATTTYYQGASGETTFDSNIGGLTLLDPSLTFSSGDLAAGGLYNASGTGINFLGFNDFVSNTPENFTVNSGKLTATNVSEVTTIDFPAAGVYAFSFHITDTSSFAFWCVGTAMGTCDNQITNTSPANVQFFGFISNTPITAPLYIHVQSGSATMVLTDFEAYSVPEANTMLLVGLGLVILPLARWRARRRA